jgi:hypothetical protein
MSLPSLALRLAALEVGAPKRKASSISSGHFGLANDSSVALALVALSRLVRSRDEPTLVGVARSALGQAVLAALRAATLRVALAVGGADPSLGEAQITTLFNLSASHVATRRLYDGGLSLPSKLPWLRAKELVAALLDALGNARLKQLGYEMGAALIARGASSSSEGGSSSAPDVAQLVAAVEADMAAMLRGPSTPSSACPTPPPPPSLPQVATTSFFIVNPSQPILENFRRLAEMRLRRPLSSDDIAALANSLDEGLSLLQSGGAEERRQLLGAASFTAAIATSGAAQLWACCMEVAERPVTDVAAVAQAVIAACSAVAAMLFSAAIGF